MDKVLRDNLGIDPDLTDDAFADQIPPVRAAVTFLCKKMVSREQWIETLLWLT